LFSFLHGQLVIRRLGFEKKTFLRQMRPVAMHLEDDVFPVLRKEKQRWFVMTKEEQDNQTRLVGRCGLHEFPFSSPCKELLALIDQLQLKEIRFDVQLEFGQMLEALLLLFYVASELKTIPPASEGYSGWNRKRMAARMKSAEGYNKFCALMRYDHDSQRFDISYHYCELFLSRTVKNYVEGQRRYRDHRVLFQAAPKAAIFVLALFCVPILLYPLNPLLAKIMWGAVIVVCAAGLGVYTHMVGAFLYTREHHDTLIKEYVEQIRKLSRFPEADPHPIIELLPDGRAVYLNPVARKMLAEWGYGADEAERILPDRYLDLVRASLERPEQALTTEANREGRTIAYTFSAFPELQSVIAAGKDISYNKKIEAELRSLNTQIQNKNEDLEAAYAMVDRELQTVAEIQRTLLPQNLPDIPNIDVAAYYETSWRAGGDYYDFFPQGNGRWAVLLADVSGHGTPAAVLMAVTHCIAHILHAQNPDFQPAQMLDGINDMLYQRYTKDTGNFVTAFCAVFDPVKGTACYARAGHNPPLLLRGNPNHIEHLEAVGGLPLGLTPQLNLQEHEIQVHQKDIAVLYTDGIVEAANKTNDLLGIESLENLLHKSQGSAERILHAILKARDTHVDGHPPLDDQTLIVIRAKKSGRATSGKEDKAL
jgi:serine phosphatase RsbU (regulator of sigma subunit)